MCHELLSVQGVALRTAGATQCNYMKPKYTVGFKMHRVSCDLMAHCDRKSEHAASRTTSLCTQLVSNNQTAQQQQGLKTWIDWAKRHRVAWEANFGAIRGHIKSCHWVMMGSVALSQLAPSYTTATESFAWLMHFFGHISFTGLAFDPKHNGFDTSIPESSPMYLLDPVAQKRSPCTVFVVIACHDCCVFTTRLRKEKSMQRFVIQMPRTIVVATADSSYHLPLALHHSYC